MHATLLLAAEKEAPLIDLDGTVLIQFGIFLVLALVLYYLVFRPYLALRDRREESTSGARARAGEMDERASAAAEEVERRLMAGRQKGEQERLRLRAEAGKQGAEVLAAAHRVAHQEIDQARASSRAAVALERTRLLGETEALARQAAARVLGRSL